jgi:NAD-dependent SIR2 family protein deacetylase
MLLATLIDTVKKKIDNIEEENILRLFEIISNEEDFTEELLKCKDIDPVICEKFLDILQENDILEINFRYQCDNEDGEINIASSIENKCVYCSSSLAGTLTHNVKKIYKLKITDLVSQIEMFYDLRLEKFVDKAYIPNLKQLKKDLDKIVPFLGSGISIPLGLPSWTGLISQLKDGLVNEGDIRQFEKYLESGDVFNAVNFLKSESVVYTDEEQIKTFIQEYINKHFRDQLDKKHHNIYDILDLKSDFYITTNYDNALSVYKGKYTTSPFVLNDIQDMQDLFKEKAQRIIHLHGNVERKKSMVVTTKDYEKVYSNDKNKSILSGIMAQKSFLFIGFSFNDKYIDDIYTLLREHIGGQHYIILSDVHNFYGRELSRKGLKPISLRVESLDDNYNQDVSENEYNSEYTQKYVYSLKQVINYILRY